MGTWPFKTSFIGKQLSE